MAKSLYPEKLPDAPRPNPIDVHIQRSQRMYGSPYNHAIESFHGRFDAAHREDREALRHSTQARSQHEAFFTRLKMTRQDAMLGLTRLFEYEARPRSPDAQQKLAASAFESLRMDLGGTEEANAAVAAHNRFMEAYAQACPYFALRARLHGANVDPDMVRLGAAYGANLPK